MYLRSSWIQCCWPLPATSHACDVCWHFLVLVSLHSKPFFCLPRPYQKEKFGGQAILSGSLLTPIWPYKNGPWAWNTSLPRDKEPTKPLLEWISFPVASSMYAPLYHLSMCVIWHLANPTAVSVQRGEGTGPFTKVQERCAKAHPECALSQLWRETQWPWGTNTHYWSWSCCLFSM